MSSSDQWFFSDGLRKLIAVLAFLLALACFALASWTAVSATRVDREYKTRRVEACATTADPTACLATKP